MNSDGVEIESVTKLLASSISPSTGCELICMHEYAFNGRTYEVVINKVGNSHHGEDVSGYQVVATDEMQTTYTLFVPQLYAEKLYRFEGRPFISDETEQNNGAYSIMSFQKVARKILPHLISNGNNSELVLPDLTLIAISNEQNTMGSDSEAHVTSQYCKTSSAKKRVKGPLNDIVEQDTRMLRVRKATLRSLQAVSALRRSTTSGTLAMSDRGLGSYKSKDKTKEFHKYREWMEDAEEHAKVPTRMYDRKKSDASLLHRMALADESTMWRTEMDKSHDGKSKYYANLLKQDEEKISKAELHAASLNEASEPSTKYAKASRSSPERRRKYKDLEKRRERGREVRFSTRQSSEDSILKKLEIPASKDSDSRRRKDDKTRENAVMDLLCPNMQQSNLQRSPVSEIAWIEPMQSVQVGLTEIIEAGSGIMMTQNIISQHCATEDTLVCMHIDSNEKCSKDLAIPTTQPFDESSSQVANIKMLQSDMEVQNPEEKLVQMTSTVLSHTEMMPIEYLNLKLSEKCWNQCLIENSTTSTDTKEISVGSRTPEIMHAIISDYKEKPEEADTDHFAHEDRLTSSIAADPVKSWEEGVKRYRSKWTNWCKEKQIIHRTSCLQLEERVLCCPNRLSLVIKLGIRYAHSPETSLAAVQLLSHAIVNKDKMQKSLLLRKKYRPAFWKWLGIAHLNLFLNEAKFDARAHYHLRQSFDALTKAFAYLANITDLNLMLRYGICLYWQPCQPGKPQHLENASTILEELENNCKSLGRCDYVNILLLHYQVLIRLEQMERAMSCVQQIIDIISDTTGDHADQQEGMPLHSNSGGGYHLTDYLLMLAYCAQRCGSNEQSSTAFSTILRLKHLEAICSKIDEMILWWQLANKCLENEDFALAIEFYGVALPLMHCDSDEGILRAHRALCHAALQDTIRYEEDLNRARLLGSSVPPPVLGRVEEYEEVQERLSRQPIEEIIHEMRALVYDPIATKLRKIYRKKSKKQASGPAEEIITYIKESLVKRKNAKSDMKHGAAFQSSQRAAMKRLRELHAFSDNDKYLPPVTAATEESIIKKGEFADNSFQKLTRKCSLQYVHPSHNSQSMLSLQEYWKKVIDISLDFYQSNALLWRSIFEVKAAVPDLTDASAFCALADSYGHAEKATLKLESLTYRHTLTLVCSSLDVAEKLKCGKLGCRFSDESAMQQPSNDNKQASRKTHRLPSLRG